MKEKIVIGLIMALLLAQTVVTAESLWKEDSESMYQDRSSFTEGDIITINIEEDSSALQSADTDTSQSNEMELNTDIGVFEFLGSILFGYSEEDRADGQTNREGKLEANITTEVSEVQDNGNLRVEGDKRLTINEEDQLITLTGVIRPDDVDRDNEISSKKVADASIEYKGEGSVADKQRPGLFSRLFNWLF
ncbi:MAG: flagellar basal body L-ring protein FlgH [Halanaerobiaceae bacterium]